MGKKTQKVITMTAGEDLLQYTRVKLESGSTTVPGEVVYADQGEQAIGEVENGVSDGDLVSIRLFAWETKEGKANDSFSYAATLYAHDDGEISDTSSGSAIGQALEAATAAGDIVEYIPYGVLSTTAATVSYLDASGFTTAATQEAVNDELYQDALSIQNLVSVPLMSGMLSDGTNTVTFGGPATDPILDMTNGDTDSAIRWTWAAASVVAVIYQVSLPADLDVTADLVIYLMCGKDADANTVTLASDAYFDVGDTKVEDVTATIAAATAETSITIAAADIPAGAKTLTIEFTPSAHAGDALYLYSVRPLCKSILKTS